MGMIHTPASIYKINKTLLCSCTLIQFRQKLICKKKSIFRHLDRKWSYFYALANKKNLTYNAGVTKIFYHPAKFYL